jgi:DNA repair protein RadC
MEITIANKKEVGQITDHRKLGRLMLSILNTESEVDRDKEHFWVIGLTVRNTIRYIELATLGLIDQTVIHPREVFRTAIMKAVHSVIVAHNHPSGESDPSEEDRIITERLAKAGKILGIPVRDHVIIPGDGDRFYSFREIESYLFKGG